MIEKPKQCTFGNHASNSACSNETDQSVGSNDHLMGCLLCWYDFTIKHKLLLLKLLLRKWKSNRKEKMEEKEVVPKGVAEGTIDEGEEEESERVVEDRTHEGERIPALVEEMENKDEEAVLVDMEESDYDEEGDIVPMKWSHVGFNEYSVTDARGNEWEYKENEVMLGSKYKDLEAIKLWSISLRM
jgi:hypothetical protein